MITRFELSCELRRSLTPTALSPLACATSPLQSAGMISLSNLRECYPLHFPRMIPLQIVVLPLLFPPITASALLSTLCCTVCVEPSSLVPLLLLISVNSILGNGKLENAIHDQELSTSKTTRILSNKTINSCAESVFLSSYAEKKGIRHDMKRRGV